MKLYFSGVASTVEAAWLAAAGVRHVLVDQFDIDNVPELTPYLALDSGAYRVFKKNGVLSLDDYIIRIRHYTARRAAVGGFDFVVAPDVIGDVRATYENWEWLINEGVPQTSKLMPVWHMGCARRALDRYLNETPGLVGIGGCVHSMREKDEQVLSALVKLAEQHPGRFHVFGLNWLKAIEELRGGIASADTSKWLDGGRYGHVIFTNTKTGHLSAAHAKKHLGLMMSRDERNIQNARSMDAFVNGKEGGNGKG